MVASAPERRRDRRYRRRETRRKAGRDVPVRSWPREPDRDPARASFYPGPPQIKGTQRATPPVYGAWRDCDALLGYAPLRLQGAAPYQCCRHGRRRYRRYQNHPDVQGKSSTESGKSPQAQATGRVPNGGAEVPENWNSPSESNGGTGGSPAPELVRAAHAGAASQGKTTNDQNNNNPSGR